MQEYIDKTINSVLNQTYKNYEIIVVNDKSTDKTLEILEKYKNNIIIINNEKNLGLGGSRNIACKHAKGEYIIYLDADDTLYENTTLEKIKEVLEKNYQYKRKEYTRNNNKNLTSIIPYWMEHPEVCKSEEASPEEQAYMEELLSKYKED